MDIKNLKKLKVGKVLKDVSMKTLTSYKVGGNASFLVHPNSINNLKILLKYLNNNKIEHKVIGNGSNLLISDKDYNGVLIKLDRINNYSISNTVIKAEAGCSLQFITQKAFENNLTGLEFAAGIPGTIGGAIYMNAGAYKSDMGDIASEIVVLTPELEIKTLYNKDLDFNYRSSMLQKNKNYICLEATLVLKKGYKLNIKSVMEDRRKRRLMTQPLNFPNAGSVFRNPENDYAGRLIEECNLKGYKIGGAIVSEKHANFIVNNDNATAQDIYDLIHHVKNEVLKKFKIDLIIEQEFFNWE